MLELSAFQDAFTAALRDDVIALAPWAPSDPEPAGLSVYRNTVVKGAVDALGAIYPTVVQLVGEDWFRGAAILYARERPPTHPSLLSYGGDFPEWLQTFPHAQDTPYLAEVARLDRLWNEAYFAADAEPLAPEAFEGLAEQDFGRLTVRLLPSAGLATFSQNIGSLWLAHRGPGLNEAGFELAETPEQVLVVRPALEVEAYLLDRSTYAFLQACADGESLLDAAERTLAADPAADLGQIAADVLRIGALARRELIQTESPIS